MYMNSKQAEEMLSAAVKSAHTICVRDVMTSDVKTMGPHDAFGAAISLMANHQFRHFVVTEADGRVVGVVSDRDILRSFARTSDWKTLDVSRIMTSEPITVKPETPLAEAVAQMVAKRINCLPVVADDGTLRGILTSTDLLMSYQTLLESCEK